MKTLALATLIALATTAAHAAPVPEGSWLLRARLINLKPANDGGHVATLGGKPQANGDTVPELDLTYFATPNLALELIAATTQHNVRTVKGSNTALGSIRLLPPTLTAQYHFTHPCLGKFKPYVGAGVTYAHFYDSDHPGLGSVKYDNAWGTALQAGVDYKLTDKVYLNADLKKIYVSTDVTVNDTISARANLNPLVAGLGIGYRF